MANILIVDDEEDICNFLSDILQRMGLGVKYVFSGEEALSLIGSEKFEIAFVDLKLSTSITGLSVIKALRDKCPQTIVAAMSGYIDVGLAQETRHLGVSDYLEKPRDIQPEAFEKKVQILLQKSGSQK
jgi:DNA-binding NtrC family response regulator